MSPSFPSRLHRGLLASTALLLAPLGCATSSQAGAARDEAALRTDEAPRVKPRWGLVIHGGAGVISRENLTPEREAAMRAALTQALQAGHAVLAKGGRSMDAVTAAIRVMEDSPYFNAGKGAVFNHDGVNELDAAVMDGKTRMAGAVAGVHHIQNPIDLARLVMEKSPHVMMVGDGAEAFAQSQGMPLVDAKYFYTEERWQGLQRALEQEKAKEAPPAGSSLTPGVDPITGDHKFGTVGAVALDMEGNLAAGTSTGGMTNKRFGRVGDAPIIGAGTYADERCAVSATGHGEFFIRYTVARDICARVEYQELPLPEAANHVINDVLVKAGGEGGVIAMDRQGHVATPFNSSGMYRGYIGEDGTPTVAIFQQP
ncbi:isoaspartyl peptidase/L-asparaginase [Corallococcus interemptor]|uniref:Isoaspartyl peptidase n=1 Tax=Corallococcus interemptor TaxID=2316720 RepID=A0A3A8PZ96_9BACT|nr:isoaspartyl peptidase/L-asparaginase [Corallococcus interemptor]RKH50841.1 isoaspartyl peptidase/L-asparaginase [Corallococcus sp. AB050B]RKH61807.1 isoaspartyl peptidase/L-asparaginase [Corallococcus interemptor]